MRAMDDGVTRERREKKIETRQQNWEGGKGGKEREVEEGRNLCRR